MRYHFDIMSKKEMEKEAEKIRNIKGINVGQNGFISAILWYQTELVPVGKDS